MTGETVPLPAGRFGSDVIAETLRDCAIPYVALNPGASFRGLHDSLVNHLGNRAPEILLGAVRYSTPVDMWTGLNKRNIKKHKKAID